MWARLKSPRPPRAAGGYLLAKAECNKDQATAEENILLDDVFEQNMFASRMTSRYRFRDLLLGDFAFNDDGER